MWVQLANNHTLSRYCFSLFGIGKICMSMKTQLNLQHLSAIQYKRVFSSVLSFKFNNYIMGKSIWKWTKIPRMRLIVLSASTINLYLKTSCIYTRIYFSSIPADLINAEPQPWNIEHQEHQDYCGDYLSYLVILSAGGHQVCPPSSVRKYTYTRRVSPMSTPTSTVSWRMQSEGLRV